MSGGQNYLLKIIWLYSEHKYKLNFLTRIQFECPNYEVRMTRPPYLLIGLNLIPIRIICVLSLNLSFTKIYYKFNINKRLIFLSEKQSNLPEFD